MAFALPSCPECRATQWREPKLGEAPDEWFSPWVFLRAWPPVVCDNCGYKVVSSYVARSATIRATVRSFSNEEGWGVLDAPECPDGIFVHFSALQMSCLRSIRAGQEVEAEVRTGDQDGYRFVATAVRPVS